MTTKTDEDDNKAKYEQDNKKCVLTDFFVARFVLFFSSFQILCFKFMLIMLSDIYDQMD